MDSIISVERLHKTYESGAISVAALDDVSFEIPRGGFVAIMGPSGSGKSTLMNVLGCLDRPTRGRVAIDGADIGRLDADGLARLRLKAIGFVFQSFNLLPRMTALDNVAMPAIYSRLSRSERRRRAAAAIGDVGLTDRAHHRPAELSGGQKQRVAIARALINDPAIILADEPTGALDSRTGLEIIDVLKRLNAQGRTVILVTHDPTVAAHANRILRFHDGRLVADERAS